MTIVKRVTRVFSFGFSLSLLALFVSCSGGGSATTTASSGATEIPAIVMQPAKQTLPAANMAVFSIEAQNTNGLSYKWQWSADGTSWNDIPGAVNSTYQILAQTADSSGWNHFRCVLTNSLGSTNSDPATLTVVTVLHVNHSSAASSPDGASWSTAYPTLQAALSVATANSEIWVAVGTYTPGSARTDSFILRQDVAVYGGFVGNETYREARNWSAHVTILSGDIGTLGDIADNCYHVVLGANNATLDGFTITAGNANGIGSQSAGGGMFNDNDISPAVTNCIFSGNFAYDGGGMFNDFDSNTVVTNCTFSNNSASHSGGGMYNYGNNSVIANNPVIANSTFFNNSAVEYGGGIYNYQSNATVTNCVISSNTCTANNGGGIYNYGGSPVITNCTVSGNTALMNGGGIFNGYSCTPTITNSIIWGNTVVGHGPQIYNNEWVGTVTLTYSAIQDGIANTDAGPPVVITWITIGNIVQDPLFSAGSLIPQAGSPCINAGNNAAVFTTTDRAGNTRISGGTVDMGAYEYQE